MGLNTPFPKNSGRNVERKNREKDMEIIEVKVNTGNISCLGGMEIDVFGVMEK